jgi:hypothetical protein
VTIRWTSSSDIERTKMRVAPRSAMMMSQATSSAAPFACERLDRLAGRRRRRVRDTDVIPRTQPAKIGEPDLDQLLFDAGAGTTIIRNPSTGILAFVAGKVDITSPLFLQVPLLKDAKRQDPEATCALVPSNVNRNVMMNREAVPFDKPELRRAVALTVDRKPGTTIIPAGTLDDTSWLKPTMEIYCDDAQSWVQLGGFAHSIPIKRRRILNPADIPPIPNRC